jgi:hypothetical protein
LFSQLQNGQLRFYIATLATAAIIVLALALAIEVLQVNKAMGE